ncbi:prevent-host-death protein [Methylobacterium aquaticum]|uniref:prevent-host-death protein n=1 Tax=Methylobacterium aquaticum TaxID=270351 RepID=UPI0019315224|nr:prevent-host-death protein [Methylobacterium aquaticum]QRE73774.1 prevent-host-death protein [Methylobacterium aquaticum]
MADQHRDDAPPERVGLRTFRAQMKAYLDQARQGRSFAVTSHGVVIAEIRPPSQPEPPPRQPGALKGRIRMTEDAGRVSATIEGDER